VVKVSSNKPVVLPKPSKNPPAKPAPKQKPVVKTAKPAPSTPAKVAPKPPVKTPSPKPKMITPMPIPQKAQPKVETLPPPPPAPPEPVTPKQAVAPKVDVEPVVLGSYFAIQILRGESYRDVVKAFLFAAEESGVLFRKLQVMDIMAIGTTAFVRIRSDVADLSKVLEKMTNRSRVSADSTGSYVVNFQDGRSGKYPTTTMNSSHKLGFGQTFVGTRIQRWKQQFAVV
jgi:hypothetical protein